MSYQVGAFCYRTLPEAGSAACSSFPTVSQLDAAGEHLKTITCEKATSTGAVRLQVVSTPLNGNQASTSYIEQTIAFPECQWPVYKDAALEVFGVLLCAAAVIYPCWKLVQYFGWGRGEA